MFWQKEIIVYLFQQQQQHHQQQEQERERELELEQEQEPEKVTTAAVPVAQVKQRGAGVQRSKYLPDRNQLQLLQFPHELKSLSSAELRALEDGAAVYAAADDDKPAVAQKRPPKNGRPVSNATPPPPPPPQPVPVPLPLPAELFDGGRPVPTPVRLDEEQRRFLAEQGIRNLYRVDYDQSGNALPLTYVLALDDRTKRRPQHHASAVPET